MLDFPYEFTEYTAEEKALLKNTFPQLRVGPKKWTVPQTFKTYAKEMYNIKIKDEDIWLLGHMRSGTTVTQELIWLICNNLDFETPKTVLLRERFPSLEHVLALDYLSKQNFTYDYELIKNSWETVRNPSDRPKFIKTHVPIDLLPKDFLKSNCKKIYLIRDPKEVLVSSYETYKRYSSTNFLDFAHFWKLAQRDMCMYFPYFEHLKEAYELEQKHNILIIYYNDLMNNQLETIDKVAKHLGKQLNAEQIEKIGNYLKNTTFHKNPMKTKELQIENKAYVRDSEAWKRYFTGDMAQELLDWIETNTRGTKIRFS